jgi:dimethylhistidine N-methyltransferase
LLRSLQSRARRAATLRGRDGRGSAASRGGNDAALAKGRAMTDKREDTMPAGWSQLAGVPGGGIFGRGRRGRLAPLSVSRPAGAAKPPAGAVGRTAFARELLAGLQQPRKTTPCKYFYDACGAALFEQICAQPEYYLTRAELSLLTRHATRLTECIGDDAELIEFGASSPVKASVLLHVMRQPAAYVPVDISGGALLETAGAISTAFPGLDVRPLMADYTGDTALTHALDPKRRRVGFFPGSSLGNFEPDEALAFLIRLRKLLQGGGLLIGVDLVKDPIRLHAAYNDAAGATAAFNRNVLVRANRELGADFRPEQFAHYAFYDPVARRIEMHLVSLCDQDAHVAGRTLHFDEGESIRTEYSHKYTVQGFRALATRAGFRPRLSVIDSEGLFSLHWLESPA